MKKKKKDLLPDPKEVLGVMWTSPMSAEAKLMCGLGAILMGVTAMKYMPKMANKLIPILVNAFTPPAGYQALPLVTYHPEGREPIETAVDERQLGRSEVIREIANPKRN